MTKAEKYLKDGVATEELIGEMETSLCVPYCEVASFWNKPIKPQLTDDERAILRSIKGQPKYISRQKGYGLKAYDKAKETKTGWSYENGREMSSFSHLFQFIKERRRI